MLQLVKFVWKEVMFIELKSYNNFKYIMCANYIVSVTHSVLKIMLYSGVMLNC